jgi:nicotianamine synthase
MCTKGFKGSVASVGAGSSIQDTSSRFDTPPTTPTARSISAHELRSGIQTIHQELSHLDNLAPGEKVNRLLTRLVQLCIVPYDVSFTDYFLSITGVDEICVSLRSLCATAEGELERYWADSLLSASSTCRKSSDTTVSARGLN